MFNFLGKSNVVFSGIVATSVSLASLSFMSIPTTLNAESGLLPETKQQIDIYLKEYSKNVYQSVMDGMQAIQKDSTREVYNHLKDEGIDLSKGGYGVPVIHLVGKGKVVGQDDVHAPRIKGNIVAFFDFSCHVCQDSAESVAELLSNNINGQPFLGEGSELNYIFRPFALFGDKGSMVAALYGMAILETHGADTFFEYYKEVMKETKEKQGGATMSIVLKVLAKVLDTKEKLTVVSAFVDNNHEKLLQQFEKNGEIIGEFLGGQLSAPTYLFGNDTIVSNGLPAESIAQYFYNTATPSEGE